MPEVWVDNADKRDMSDGGDKSDKHLGSVYSYGFQRHFQIAATNGRQRSDRFWDRNMR